MIQYGKNVELPDVIYERAIQACRVDGDGHWIWYGSAANGHPQIGAISLVNGKKKLKVVSVAKLIFVVKNGLMRLPYQVRRDKRLCQNKSCVAPHCHYAIMDKP